MIFILGGNGFVGAGFVSFLTSVGLPFAVIDRKNYASYAGAECDIFINANGNSKKFLAEQYPKVDFDSSVSSVRNSLVDFRFRKYIFLSTSDVYPDCSSPKLTLEDATLNVANQSCYGFHKYLAELCVRNGAKDWIIIRQGGFVGHGLKKNAVFDVLKGGKIWAHEASRYQFINTEDSARLVMQLVDHNIRNEVFNLTATGTISVKEIMHLAATTLPGNSSVRPVRYELSTDKVARFVQLPSTYDTVKRFLEMRSLVAR
jgi:nucleoside-diphosphate-sugar epimerase